MLIFLALKYSTRLLSVVVAATTQIRARLTSAKPGPLWTPQFSRPRARTAFRVAPGVGCAPGATTAGASGAPPPRGLQPPVARAAASIAAAATLKGWVTQGSLIRLGPPN